MAGNLNLRQPGPLEKKGKLSENWRKWKQSFIIYLGANKINLNDLQATAIFLHVIGDYGLEIFNQLELSESEKKNVEELIKKFDEFCNPTSNLISIRNEFFETKQKRQSFSSFLKTVKQNAKNCKFGSLTESLILTQVVRGLANKKVRDHFTSRKILDLQTVIDQCRLVELNFKQNSTKATPKRMRTPKSKLLDVAIPKSKNQLGYVLPDFAQWCKNLNGNNRNFKFTDLNSKNS